MKRLLGLLLVVGIVGCVGPVAKLEKLGAYIRQNELGEVIEVSLGHTTVTDAGRVYLKGLINLGGYRFVWVERVAFPGGRWSRPEQPISRDHRASTLKSPQRAFGSVVGLQVVIVINPRFE